MEKNDLSSLTKSYGESSALHLRVNFAIQKVTHRNNSVCRVWGTGLLSTWPDLSCSSSILKRQTWEEVQRGLILYQLGKNPHQIAMIIFLPVDDWKNPFQLVLDSGLWFWFVFTWICCPQGFSATHKNFQPFHFMANITLVQEKCDICWIHCPHSIPVTIWCNFYIKSNARPHFMQNLFFSRRTI